MRARWKAVAERFVAELADADPVTALERTADAMGWMRGHNVVSKAKALKQTEAILKKPDVTAAIRELYGLHADFTVAAGAQKLVDWIEGRVEYDQTFATKAGPVTAKVTAPPSLEALKTYLAIALPKPAKQVNVDQRTLVARVLVTDKPPTTKARVLAIETHDA